MANAAKIFASLADLTFDNPFIPSANKRTARSSIEKFMMLDNSMLIIYFFLLGLRLNIASIRSVTRKPPTTLKRANPRDIDPIIKSGLPGSDLIIAVNAANIVIPEIAFAPLIKGV